MSSLPPQEGIVRNVAYIESKAGSRVDARFYICHPNADVPSYPLQDIQEFILDAPSSFYEDEGSSVAEGPLDFETAKIMSMNEPYDSSDLQELLRVVNATPPDTLEGLAELMDNLPTSLASKASQEAKVVISALEDLSEVLAKVEKVSEMTSRSSPAIKALKIALKQIPRSIGDIQGHDATNELLRQLSRQIMITGKVIRVLLKNDAPTEKDYLVHAEVEGLINDVKDAIESGIAHYTALSTPTGFLRDFVSRHTSPPAPPASFKVRYPNESYRTLFAFGGDACKSSHRFFGVIEPFSQPYAEGFNIVAGNAVGISPYGGMVVSTKKQWWDFYDEARRTGNIHRGGPFVIDLDGKVFEVPNNHPRIVPLGVPTLGKSGIPSPRKGSRGGVFSYIYGVLEYVVATTLNPKSKPEKGLRFVCPWYSTHPVIMEVLSNVFPRDIFMCAHVLYESSANSSTRRENVVYFSNAAGIPGLSSLYRSKRMAGLPPPEHSLYTNKAQDLFYNRPKTTVGRVQVDDLVVADALPRFKKMVETLVALEHPPSTTVDSVVAYVIASHNRTEGWAPKKAVRKDRPRKTK